MGVCAVRLVASARVPVLDTGPVILVMCLCARPTAMSTVYVAMERVHATLGGRASIVIPPSAQAPVVKARARRLKRARVIRAGVALPASSTQGPRHHVQVLSSTDVIDTAILGDVAYAQAPALLASSTQAATAKRPRRLTEAAALSGQTTYPMVALARSRNAPKDASMAHVLLQISVSVKMGGLELTVPFRSALLLALHTVHVLDSISARAYLVGKDQHAHW